MQRVRLKYQVTHNGSPFHLGRVANECALEASVNGIGVSYIYPFSRSAPDDLEGNRPLYGRRSTREQGISAHPIIEDRNLTRLYASPAFLELNINIPYRNLDSPKQPNRRESSRIKIMKLFARTGQIDIYSNKGE